METIKKGSRPGISILITVYPKKDVKTIGNLLTKYWKQLFEERSKFKQVWDEIGKTNI